MPAATLASVLYLLEQYGPAEPSTLLGPVRQGLGKFGDGLFVEEGTTNLLSDPSFGSATTGGWAALAGCTLAYSAARAFLGAGSLQITPTATGSTGFYLSSARPAVTAGQTYTFSFYFYGPSRSVTAEIDWYNASTVLISNSQANVSATTANGWTRVTVTGTAPALTASCAPVIFINNAVLGDLYYVDAVQFENKAYATSYADGSLATAWNAAGNLLPTAAQSFEDGTTGGFTFVQGTLANDATTGYAGTKSLRLTATTTATQATNGPLVAVTANKTYTGFARAKSTAGTARSVAVAIAWYDASQVFISLATGTSQATATGYWTTATCTAVAPSNAAYALVQLQELTPAVNDAVSFDTVRFEEGTGSAAYRWTGAENASTSTRTAADLRFTLPSAQQLNTVSIAGWLRVAELQSASNAIIGSLGDGTANNRAILYVNNGTLTVATVFGGTGSSVSLGVTVAAGDLVFAAITVSGTAINGYVSKNGGAVVNASGTAAGTATTGSAVAVGCDGLGGGYADGVVEQVLVYNRALTSTEVSALAFAGQETAFKDDPGIAFAAGTGVVRGTTKASTTAGTGYYRSTRQVSAYVEPITAIGSNPDDDTATMKATVPAGSGVGQGALVTFAPDGTRYAVQRVFSPGGVNDELWLAAA